jgi:hypothetical protein
MVRRKMKMNEAEKNERIKAVEEQMEKLKKELEDIRNTKVQEWDFSAWNNNPLRKRYEFDIPADSYAIIPFNEKLDMLTKLMKFKFCYDYSYAPDWSKPDEFKWYVYFNTQDGKYNYDWIATWDRPSTVYFSSEEIAQKCTYWLNTGCPGYLEED